MLITRHLKTIAFVLTAVLALGVYSFSLAGYLPVDEGSIESKYRHYQFFASSTAPSTVATTTSATSTNITAYFDAEGRLDNGSFDIRGAKEVTVYFSRGGATSPNTGSTRFNVQVTPDGTNWVDYKDLRAIDAEVFTSAGYDTRVASSTIGAATSTKSFTFDSKGFRALRCIVVETTDGEHACSASAQY